MTAKEQASSEEEQGKDNQGLDDQNQTLDSNDSHSQDALQPKEDQPINEPQLPRIQIAVDPGRGGSFRITIEALDGQGGSSTEETVVITVPQDGERPAEPLAEPLSPRVLQAPTLTKVGGGSGLSGQLKRIIAELKQRNITLAVVLFVLALGVYLLTRLIGLEKFPIFFFTDEAVQTVLAADLVRDNFFGYDKIFLPTYFRNGYHYNLSLSVYLQLLPYLFFGKSVIVTRATSVLVTLLAPLAIGLSLRDIFKSSYWWVGAFVLTTIPAWFLHSRTAFETVLAASLYAVLLYVYLLYRYRSPRYMYPALVLAALVFYSYSPAQVYIAVTGVLLLLSDARYHWENRRIAVRGIGLLLILAIPYIRFRINHSEATVEHLRVLGSYWLGSTPLSEKLSLYFREYLFGLSPGYWFVPNEHDLIRHVMLGYGHLLRFTLPFMALGLLLILRNIRESSYRTLLIALLAAPTGAAIVEVGVTRLLVFVIPAALIISLGLSQVVTWLERLRLPRTGLALGLFISFSVGSFAMTRDALVNGPQWFEDYGLHGMQFGANEVFGKIEQLKEESPDQKVILSPSWTNGTDVVARFFLPDPLPIQLGSIEGFLLHERQIEDNTLFVLPSYEYSETIKSGKFTDIEIRDILPYPDGRPGFYFLEMRYIDNIEEILAAERAERAKLRETFVSIAGETVQTRYPMLDMGEIQAVFDGDPITVARTLEANPFILELTFPQPRQISGYDIVIGSAHGKLFTYLYPAPDEPPVEVVREFAGSLNSPEVTVTFDEPVSAQVLRIEIHDQTQGEVGHVHLWELTLQ